MRALIVGAGPGATPLTVETLNTASEYIVAADGGADVCLAVGLIPDIVVGDFDSIDARVMETLKGRGVEVERFSTDKDETDLALAVSHAITRGATELRATGIMGGRVDHTLAALGTLAAAGVPVTFMERDCHGWILCGPRGIECRVPGDGTVFSVIALDGPSCVSVSGARWPLNRDALVALSPLGLSNVVVGQEAVVEAHQGAVAVFVPSEP